MELDIELLVLLLQLHVTNTRNFVEDTFIRQTTNSFSAKYGNFHFSFKTTFIFILKTRDFSKF
ncbi:DUF5777 family beta-barrel protein [Polaribacter sp. PL03]|uniref:DUF5777 family beta-barrel protein n=1 Tax=Polaribacter sp. PL03 TaxID=3088353 RepID=UPI0029D2D6C4|nr:DUF5777 family beta-barrel protein [Polaribacter sp. PL03]MDX6746358.1 DUF5777 family beta-barrel protein [Polaribacter sp. PL03]